MSEKTFCASKQASFSRGSCLNAVYGKAVDVLTALTEINNVTSLQCGSLFGSFRKSAIQRKTSYQTVHKLPGIGALPLCLPRYQTTSDWQVVRQAPKYLKDSITSTSTAKQIEPVRQLVAPDIITIVQLGFLSAFNEPREVNADD